ncbi:MAG: hypothetical protein NTX53_02070 [candidate division WOR-3 bacterium]|nr:hypothetical protein [candidate division WOR-3 bacterium]
MPVALLRLIDRFDQDRKVFLSGGYKEERLPKAKTPHVWADCLRLTAYGMDVDEFRTVEGGS